MITVFVVAEGQTEESFIRDVVQPAFWARRTYLSPRLIATSRHGRGGALNWNRVLRYLRNTLRERSDTYVTTFFDLYGLPQGFPGLSEAIAITDPLARSLLIESRMLPAVVTEAQCREARFIPYIQPYEFESLLFCDVTRFREVRSEWQTFEQDLDKVREAAPSSEHINEGPDTHPSAHLRRLKPTYQKVLHGSQLASRIGLTRIRAECAHFSAWLAHLESLQPLT